MRSPVDILSFSLGGFVAQALVIKHPGPVRELILTGTGPLHGGIFQFHAQFAPVAVEFLDR